MKVLFPIAALLLASASPLLADQAPAEKTQDAKKSDIHSRVVCREDNEIGSLVRKKRICMTVAQWRQLSDESGSATERRETQTTIRGGG